MTLAFYHRSKFWSTILCFMLGLCAVRMQAQDPVRTVEMNLYNNSNYIIQRAPAGLVSGWTLVWPGTVGTSGSLLLSTVAGSVNSQSWLTPGTNGQVLSVVGGLPSWSDNNTNWLLTGNGNATAVNFLGPTTASIPLNLATANATPGNINFYIGTVAAANLRMTLTNTQHTIGDVTNNVATVMTGTLSATGNTTLASTAGSTVTLTNATGSLTVNGTALTSNVTMTSLGGVAKAVLPVGYDRVVISNAAGQLDEATYSAVVGNVAWVLTGNSNAIATNFLGPTTASIPLNLATSNATAGDINFYLGTVGAANLRMNLSTASGLAIGNATNSVNTAVTGTLSSTGNTTLASTAGTTVTLTNATGSLTVNGTALTPNVTMTSLGGVARTTTPVGYDRVVVSNATGQLDEVATTSLLGNAWLLVGNASTTAWNGTTGSFLGTTSTQPLSIATTNATAQDIRFYTGASGASERMRINSTGEVGIGTTAVAGVLLQVDGVAGTPNVRMGSLSGTAITTIYTPLTTDGIVVADVNGALSKRSVLNVVNAGNALSSGTVALTVGTTTITVANTTIQANSRILVTYEDLSGSGFVDVMVSAKVAATSFTAAFSGPIPVGASASLHYMIINP